MTASSWPCLTCAPISKYHFFRYPLVREKIGEVMNGCTFPGRMISWAEAVGFGDTTDTAVRATCAVSALRAVRALTRDQMPEARRATIAIAAIARPSQCLCGPVPSATSLDGSV